MTNNEAIRIFKSWAQYTQEHPEEIKDVEKLIEMQDTILKYIDELEEESIWLSALEASGVDNWSGYEYAQDIREEWRKEDIE